MKGSTRMICVKDMGNFISMTEVFTKETGRKENKMDKEK